MPLVTRFSNQGQVFKEATTPNWLDGDLWSDTTTNTVKVNVAGVATAIGKSSFSSSAVTSASSTIGDYTTPTGGVSSSNGITNTLEGPVTPCTYGTQNPYWNIGSTLLVFGTWDNGASTTINRIIITKWRADTNQSGQSAYGIVETSTDNVVWTRRHTTATVSYPSEWNGGSEPNWDSGTVAYTARYARVGIYMTVSSADNSVVGLTDWDMYYDADSVPTNVTDDDTATYWESQAEVNPNIYVDMGGSALNNLGCAIYLNANTTETEIAIRVSTDTTFTAGENTRTILVTNLTAGAYNYIRFNLKNARYLQIYGNSGASKVLAINEIKYLTKTDAQVLQDLGILEISTTDTNLALDGT